jgi:hypothetical protein
VDSDSIWKRAIPSIYLKRKAIHFLFVLITANVLEDIACSVVPTFFSSPSAMNNNEMARGSVSL